MPYGLFVIIILVVIGLIIGGIWFLFKLLLKSKLLIKLIVIAVCVFLIVAVLVSWIDVELGNPAGCWWGLLIGFLAACSKGAKALAPSIEYMPERYYESANTYRIEMTPKVVEGFLKFFKYFVFLSAVPFAVGLILAEPVIYVCSAIIIIANIVNIKKEIRFKKEAKEDLVSSVLDD